MNKIKKYRFDIIKYLFIAGLIVLAIVNFDRLKNIFSYLLTISMLIILGFIIMYILNIPMVMLRNYIPIDSIVVKDTRPVSILVSIIITVVLIFILNLVLPQLISVFGRIIEIIPVLANGIQR